MSDKASIVIEKKILWLLLCVIIMATLTVLFVIFKTSDKIAYIESGKVLAEYKGADEARKEYESKTKIWQSNIDTLTTEVQIAINQYERDLATLSVKEQNQSKQKIAEKQKQLQEYQKAIQENAQQENSKLTQSIVTEINAFLKEYGKKHHYKLILIANQSGTIAYAEEGMDITDQLIIALNEDYANRK